MSPAPSHSWLAGAAATALLGAGCFVTPEAFDARRAELRDDDRDGFSEVDGDCDDTNSQVHPDAPERCDGRDNNCDGKA